MYEIDTAISAGMIDVLSVSPFWFHFVSAHPPHPAPSSCELRRHSAFVAQPRIS